MKESNAGDYFEQMAIRLGELLDRLPIKQEASEFLGLNPQKTLIKYQLPEGHQDSEIKTLLLEFQTLGKDVFSAVYTTWLIKQRDK